MISLFSPLWFVVVIVFMGLAFLLPLFFKGRSRETRRKFMIFFSMFVTVYWFVYKGTLLLTPGYDFVWWNELPLYLCNVTMFLAIFAAWRDSRLLQSFCYFVGLLGALFAMFTPDADFINVPLLSTRGIGYWGYHGLMITLCLSFVTLKVYSARYRDVPRAIATILGLGLVMHLLCRLLRACAGIEANYFFTFGIDGNPLTELLYKLIPVYFVFLLPMLLPVGLVDLLLAFLGHRAKPLKEE